MCPPIITPDFSEAQELEPIPTGVYNARIVDVEQKTAKSSGNTYLKWKLQLFGAEGDLAKYNNWPVFYNTMTSGKGAGMLKQFAKAVLKEVPTQLDTDAFLGKEVQISLQQGKDQDGNPSTWPEVKSVKALH